MHRLKPLIQGIRAAAMMQPDGFASFELADAS